MLKLDLSLKERLRDGNGNGRWGVGDQRGATRPALCFLDFDSWREGDTRSRRLKVNSPLVDAR